MADKRGQYSIAVGILSVQHVVTPETDAVPVGMVEVKDGRQSGTLE
jgi:hypothetical protein